MNLLGLAWLAPLAASAAVYTDAPLRLYDGHRVTARIVAPDHPSPLETLAIGKLIAAARDVYGFHLPVVAARDVQDLANSIVIGTPTSNPVLWRTTPPEGDGFLIERLEEAREPALALVAHTPRGVFNGAAYLAEFSLQAHAGVVTLQTQTVRRRSPIRQRGTYNLVCWGLAPRYTRQDWEHILDAMADDGMNVIYFWLSGIFRSKLFPESFIYPETPLTTEDIRQLIRHAHSRGISFHLGTGVFAWFGIDDIAKYHAEFRDPGVPYMSRTLPAARQAMKRYLHELYDAFPEADGMWLEIGDEGDYACKDPACQKPLDEFGSKVAGQASPDFLKEFSAELWQKHPQAKLVWGIGYPEAHKWDVQYYERLRRDFRDPRYYFLEVRQNWELQDREGVLKPLRDLSPNAMHWDQYYGLPLRDIGERAHRIAEDGLAGYIAAFEPGFNSHSVFGRTIPFPADAIPYRLTRFAYREFTWDPNLSWTGFKKRLLDAFFGEGADPELFDLTYTLFEFMRTGPISGSFRELTHPVDGSAYGRMLKPRLAAIEARLNNLEPRLGPKGKAVGVPLLRRAIADLRLGYAVP
ncbi:MAG TPA: hypothetical protein VFA33_13210 [Bryobacteraceae bacterium]|nr:hypothetical protein [Bryobacteraceae bacterium]